MTLKIELFEPIDGPKAEAELIAVELIASGRSDSAARLKYSLEGLINGFTEQHDDIEGEN